MITETPSQEKRMFRKQVFMLQNVEQVVDSADEGVMQCLQDDICICMITFYTLVIYHILTLSLNHNVPLAYIYNFARVPYDYG